MIKSFFVRLFYALLLGAFLLIPCSAAAQTPVALPYTMTTIAGGVVTGTTTYSSTTPCIGAPSTDSANGFGDNCPAMGAIPGGTKSGTGNSRGGVAVDALGNVFVGDDINGVIQMINPTTGAMTLVAGGASACSGTQTKMGDNCVAAQKTAFNGPRGVAVDPYGNVLIADYNYNMIHVVCRAASPLCTAAQIGYMEAVAGCTTALGSGASGTAGKGTDNAPGLVLGGSCGTNTAGEVDGARGVAADMYGNVYFADTSSSRYRVILGPQSSSYFTGSNPLYAALQLVYGTPTKGYAYTLAGMSTTPTVKGTSCSGAALDTLGDGCAFNNASVYTSNSANITGVSADAAGNMVFTDGSNGVRVFFANGSGTAGAAMANAIFKTNGVTAVSGYVYRLAGGGTGTLTAAPAAGNTILFPDATANKLTVSPQGNIYIGDNTQVYFFDLYNGTIRILLKSGTSPALGAQCGTTGAYAKGKYGEGCPVTGTTSYAAFGNSNGLGIAVDGQGNLYMYDAIPGTTTPFNLVRKVVAQGASVQSTGTLAAVAASPTYANPLNALGVTQAQVYMAHFPSATGNSVSVSISNSSFSYATPNCTWNSSSDNSLDCAVTVTNTPPATSAQTATMTLTAQGGESILLNLGGTVAGSVLAIDSPTSGGTSLMNTAALLSGYNPYSVAVDGAGNVYAAVSAGGSYSILESVGGSPASAVPLATALTSQPFSLAVDAAGDVFYLNGSSAIQELAAGVSNGAITHTPATLSYVPQNLGAANPVALTVDTAGNLLVADNQSGTDDLYLISLTANRIFGATVCNYPATASPKAVPTLCQSVVAGNSSGSYAPLSMGVINALATDPAGNIYASDSTGSKIWQLTPGMDATLHVWDYAANALLSSVVATGLATDAAGDLYVQSASGVTMYPLSGPSSAGVAVYSTEGTPAGIAVDSAGNVYNADTATTAITQVQRSTVTENFASNYGLWFAAQLSNIGNQASLPQTAANGVNAGAFTLSGGSHACSFGASLLGAMAPGQSCSLTAQFPAIGSGPDVDTIVFTPTAPSLTVIGSLTLTGVADQEGYDTTTAIGTPSTNSPVFLSSGTEVSFPVTVTASSTSTDHSTSITAGPTTSNYVLISMDGGAAASYNFTATNGLTASLTLNLAGLAAGSHSFTVNFPQQGTFLTSSASSGAFSIATEGTSIAWNPASTTQQVSTALGTGVLNATVTPAIAGNFAYALGAAPDCNAYATSTTTPIDASTYLPIGSYTIYVTFCPTDSVDYTSSTASISGYTVTQAATLAAVGASTMVVAPSGANFTSLTTALQALPASGGTIYLAPGTYSGQNAISYPNVQLRGLGGDPTQVVLSGENGAFSSTALPSGFTLGPAGKGGDEGGATLDVSKNGFMGLSAATSGTTPNNFYAEYLTIQNTYNTDAVTTSTWYAAGNGGSCSSGGSAQTLEYLYNNNQQCGSQALALYLNSDGAVLNNVNLLSQQDTLYASAIGCGTYCTVAREYMWQGLISGNVDYTFGDAALVFDHTNFFTTWHGLSASAGQETITAQNKRVATGSTNGVPNSTIANNADYLSGFVCNGCTLMSQSTGMSKLYYGRPWNINSSTAGTSSYSTWIMLNSNVDQVNPSGWIGWDGAQQYLSTSTYGEFNTMAYTDPQVGNNGYPAALYNSTPPVLYAADIGNATASSLVPTGQNNGSGAVVTSNNRENAALKLSAASAVPWYPVNFLSTLVPATKLSAGQSANWNPVAALAAQVNNFVPVASVGAIAVGGSVTILGRPQTPGAGVIPSGSYAFYDSLNNNQVCTSLASGCSLLASGTLDRSGEAYLTTSALAAGMHYITMVYGGDTNFTGSTSSTYSVYVLNPGQSVTTTALAVANTSSTTGTPLSGTVALSLAPSTAPAAINAPVSIYLDGVAATTCTLLNGTCSWSIPGPSSGAHTMYAYYAGSTAYGHSTSSTVSLFVSAPVATGDTRTIAEPLFPAVCTQLTAALTTDPLMQDLDATVDASTTNIDGARIQAALNSCSASAIASGKQLSVELSMDATATYNAFLSGPLSMPSNVTLLVDPNVTLYFSRNVQDYDKVAGTHTCGTINGGSNTSSCWPLIDIPGTSTNVGIMGYGKINGRGGDLLLNAFATSGYGLPSPPTWWNLASAANGVGNQMNPRFVQMEGGSSNITLYKITLMNSPNFHVSTTGSVNNFTAWDIKIVTPTAARNTDGIDPGSVTNATITRSWISGGDDNVAVGASGTGKPSANISVVNNHFFAGHGESIGSYTSSGVSNILFDSNMSVGNAFAGHGSAVDANGLFSASSVADTNSTAIRIKTANDRGGLVTGIQYSNSCFLDHKSDVQFTPYYSSGDSTNMLPSYTGILLQNLVFMNDASSSGTVELTGEYNTNTGSPVTNPLTLTMDNVTFPSALSSLVNSVSPVESSTAWGNNNSSGGTGQYTNLAVGPGNVSSNFLTAYNALAAVPVNADALASNISISTLNPPACVFTFLAPELTGPNNVAQSVPYNTPANVDVILTPAVGGAAFPTGTVTVTDTTTSNTFTGTLSGTGDTVVVTIPAPDLTLGTHTFTATYLGDANYTIPASYQTFGSYPITVVQATPTISWTPATTSITYGTTLNGLLNATASVQGNFTYTATPTAGGATMTVTNSSVLQAGTYTMAASFVPSDSVDYTHAASTFTLTVNKAVPALSWATPPAIAYGSTLAGVLNPAATFASTAVAGSFGYTAAPAAGGTAVVVTGATVLAAGNWTLKATFAPADATDYVAAGTISVSLSVGQIAPAVALIPTATTVVLQNPVTFNVTVKSSASTPTGSVNFLDGTTVLATVPLSAGAASYTSSSLALGNHTITAAYLGDNSFQTASSSAAAISVITISIGTVGSGGDASGSGSGASQVIEPGGVASYALPILPNTGNSFPIALTLSVSGLPTGATATVTPAAWVTQANGTSWILPANTALTGATQLDIHLPAATASNHPASPSLVKRVGPLAFALLLLPFAGRIRRSGKRMARMLIVLLILAAGAAATTGITACSGSGFFAQEQQSYTVTVTVASGNLSQTMNLNLSVE